MIAQQLSERVALWPLGYQVNTSEPIYKIGQRVFAAKQSETFSAEEKLSACHYEQATGYHSAHCFPCSGIGLTIVGAESFRMPRQAEEEKGTIANVMGTLKSYYDKSVDTASGYVDTIKGYKLEEKAKNLYDETVSAVTTYAGIFNDQIYHMFYSQDSS
ncbi:apolipoprotein C-II isoform X1 [Xyrauchen texanus]|uniref:apolipoprotein C-II isoform X1 n=1 Tax=Xyrauchen texanus TaxID=154827 RepID=UPI0022426744|nr:apolipoprotein C-II isoform X1 [Xyrauchen texanus]